MRNGKASKPAQTDSLKSNLIIDPARVRSGTTSSRLAEAILIIGFDTDYQKPDVVPGDNEANLSNTVLSYQYCCTLIHEGDEGADRHCCIGLA